MAFPVKKKTLLKTKMINTKIDKIRDKLIRKLITNKNIFLREYVKLQLYFP